MSSRPRVVILGGGIAGLTAAWRLSEPGWEGRFASITVLERGFRLGGKGASGRGVHGRIEEHGLHVWLGHYDNAFRLIRDCYAELDRDRTDPRCPIRRWEQAFRPAGQLGLFDSGPGGWAPWVATFTQNRQLPGEPTTDGRATSVVEMLLRQGAGGVHVLSCPPRDCYFREGARWLEQRLWHDREAELQPRVDRRRVRASGAGVGEVADAAAAVAAFVAEVKALHPPAELPEPSFECEASAGDAVPAEVGSHG